ncbi:Sedlin [Xylariaceae sp. FL0255]|nr:Sedlin [Xylariaceae sp. FL0255]
MTSSVPAIACLGVIGRNNNPLHISIFPSHDASTNTYAPARTPLQFSLILSATLDIFEARARAASSSSSGQTQNPAAGSTASMLLSGDYGLLHAVDDRLAAYGFETNTGVKFVAVVDMRGRAGLGSSSGIGSGAGEGGSGNTSGRGTGSGGSGSGIGTGPGAGGVGLRDTDLKPVFRAMQTAYVRLLQNPFYDPDETVLGGKGGVGVAGGGVTGTGGGIGGSVAKRITSKRFSEDMRRIGEKWAPGVTTGL